MRLLDLTLPDIAANLALDEALLLEAEAGSGSEMLRLWELPSPAVVLGAGGVIREDVEESGCASDGIPILRRSSGGGTVLLGPGCLCYSLILRYTRSPALAEIRSSYTFILSNIAEALVGVMPEQAVAGISDLTSAGLKFSGNAQQQKREHLLHHGTLLYAFDLGLLRRYLKEPPRQPDYRGGRSHEGFVRNLPCTAVELRERLCAAWDVSELTNDWPRDRVTELLATRYQNEEWIRRRLEWNTPITVPGWRLSRTGNP